MNRPGEVNLKVLFADGSAPSLETLGLLVDGLLPLLNEYGKSFFGEELKWDISTLSFSSIGLGVYPDQTKKPHIDEFLCNMSRRFVQDLAAIEGGLSIESTATGHDVRLWRKWILLLADQDVSRVEVESDGVAATLTAAGVGSMEVPRPAGAVVDTVRGTIQGVNFSNGTYFTLHREADNRPVRCYFAENMGESVIDGLRKRVSVTGRVKRDASGEYTSMSVTLPPRLLRSGTSMPRIADLVGIAKDLSLVRILDEPEETRSVR